MLSINLKKKKKATRKRERDETEISLSYKCVKICFTCCQRVALWFYVLVFLFLFFILGFFINTCLGMTKLYWPFPGIISLAVLVRPTAESARTLVRSALRRMHFFWALS